MSYKVDTSREIIVTKTVDRDSWVKKGRTLLVKTLETMKNIFYLLYFVKWKQMKVYTH